MSKRKCGCIVATARNTSSVRSKHELGGYIKVFCLKHNPTKELNVLSNYDEIHIDTSFNNVGQSVLC